MFLCSCKVLWVNTRTVTWLAYLNITGLCKYRDRAHIVVTIHANVTVNSKVCGVCADEQLLPVADKIKEDCEKYPPRI